MTCCFTTFSTVFQSYQDDECVIMKGCVQWNPVLQLKGSFPRMGSTLQPLYYYCLTYGDTRVLAVTGKYGIMKKKAQMRREILRGSDTYVSN